MPQELPPPAAAAAASAVKPPVPPRMRRETEPEGGDMDHHHDRREGGRPTPQDPVEYAAASGTGNPDADRGDIAEEVPPAQASSLEDPGEEGED
ncbi:hypothetical protein [Microbacterium immunditiarum]|uniref:Uncharacterized protein n=1 Tax=Microbacterium immunditiarum TaxID=337480 RepID=A0A7Y9GNN4_9MICO|nr:hypothetical protein [Microbacterium immunditiarum]NYE19631.1 hypothetical protein [Microbacterium immunditiarum]